MAIKTPAIAEGVEPDSSTEYTGPSVPEMLRSHTLAYNIITRHNDACPILGPSELILLRRYVNAPSTHEEILRDCGMAERPPPGQPNRHGSLVGYVIAKNAEASQDQGTNPAMSDNEIDELKEWFQSGVPDSRMQGACETGKGTRDDNYVWRP